MRARPLRHFTGRQMGRHRTQRRRANEQWIENTAPAPRHKRRLRPPPQCRVARFVRPTRHRNPRHIRHTRRLRRFRISGLHLLPPPGHHRASHNTSNPRPPPPGSHEHDLVRHGARARTRLNRRENHPLTRTQLISRPQHSPAHQILNHLAGPRDITSRPRLGDKPLHTANRQDHQISHTSLAHHHPLACDQAHHTLLTAAQVATEHRPVTPRTPLTEKRATLPSPGRHLRLPHLGKVLKDQQDARRANHPPAQTTPQPGDVELHLSHTRSGVQPVTISAAQQAHRTGRVPTNLTPKGV